MIKFDDYLNDTELFELAFSKKTSELLDELTHLHELVLSDNKNTKNYSKKDLNKPPLKQQDSEYEKSIKKTKEVTQLLHRLVSSKDFAQHILANEDNSFGKEIKLLASVTCQRILNNIHSLNMSLAQDMRMPNSEQEKIYTAIYHYLDAFNAIVCIDKKTMKQTLENKSLQERIKIITYNNMQRHPSDWVLNYQGINVASKKDLEFIKNKNYAHTPALENASLLISQKINQIEASTKNIEELFEIFIKDFQSIIEKLQKLELSKANKDIFNSEEKLALAVLNTSSLCQGHLSTLLKQYKQLLQEKTKSPSDLYALYEIGALDFCTYNATQEMLNVQIKSRSTIDTISKHCLRHNQSDYFLYIPKFFQDEITNPVNIDSTTSKCLNHIVYSISQNLKKDPSCILSKSASYTKYSEDIDKISYLYYLLEGLESLDKKSVTYTFLSSNIQRVADILSVDLKCVSSSQSLEQNIHAIVKICTSKIKTAKKNLPALSLLNARIEKFELDTVIQQSESRANKTLKI